MRVCASSPTAFHLFDLARQLQRLECLEGLYTSYPRRWVKGVAPDKVQNCSPIAGGALLLRRYLPALRSRRLDRLIAAAFDDAVSRRLSECDILHCLSGFGIKTYRVARKYGAAVVCDRGSSHILAQDEVLREEYSCRGIRYPGIDPWTIERELAEYDSSDAICVPSEFVYRSFVEKGIPSYKLWKNSFGVDLTMFRSIPKEDEVFRVIFVGSLSVRKGVAYLLEAIRSLALPNCDLWLIGEAQAELTSILKNHEEDFRGIGVVPISELYKFYSQGSVFVLPSIEEGLSLVLAQAMACGLPVIATTNSGAEDLYNDGIEGFIVEPRNARAIAEKIEFLYRNPNVREVMGRAALQRVKALNGWNQYGARALEMYKEILDSRCSEPSRFPPIAACSVSR